MSSAAPRTLSILLVEDSPLDGRLLVEALRPASQAGEVVVQTVKRLSAAVAELQRFRFSCVLLDLGLPDGQGVDNIRALRAVDSSVAIVVLTGLDDERSASEALRLGAQDYLVKGETDGEQLMKLIRRAVQRHRQTEELEQQRESGFFQASRDPLTLLPNRALLLDRARVQLAEARSGQREFGLASLRVDGIEQARQRYGALVADELLRRLAELMSEDLRGSDTLARTEDQGFALLLYPLQEPGQLTESLRRLAQRVAALRQVGSCTVQPQLHAGLAIFSGVESAEDLLERAQRVATVPVPVEEAAAGLLPGSAAPAAGPQRDPEAGLGDCRWQPWVDTETGLCAGLELLPPWIAADDAGFAAVELESSAASSAAAELSLGAVDLAQRQWRVWQQSGFEPERLALNLPAAALRQRDFAARLQALLAGGGLLAEQMQFEIDAAVLRNPYPHQDSLMALHARGFRLVLDGEGGEELGLQQLSLLPLAGIKLSRRLLRSLLEDNLQGSSRRCLAALLGAAQGLGLGVVATGVDAPEALAALRVMGLRWMQGEHLVPALEPHLVPVQWPRPVRLG